MAFNIHSLIGVHTPGTVNAPAEIALGTTVRGVDPIQGEGMFVYLAGCAGTVAGAAVVYDTVLNTTTLVVAGARGPVAIAMGATVAGTFGLYQVHGAALVKETGATAGANAYATATAGTSSATTVAGDKIDSMRFKSADVAGFAYAQIAFPSLNANG